MLENFRKANILVEETIRQFNKDQWKKGIDIFQVPSNIAQHIIDTLDYYFREDPNKEHKHGQRFGGGWWELPDEKRPTQDDLLEYLKDIENRINQHFVSLNDDDLLTPYDDKKQFGETRLGHYLYALRHTMHHHGALSLLSLYYGNETGHWE